MTWTRSTCFTALLLSALLFIPSLHAQPPEIWRSIGPGGGGALFVPSFSPHDGDELFTASDMSGIYHTTSLGQEWTTVPFLSIEGGRISRVQFTSDPSILYCLDLTPIEGGDTRTPVRSLDGGATWTPLPTDPASTEAFTLLADPTTTTRLLISSWCYLYFTNDGGTSFDLKYTSDCGGNGLHLAGAFFDGSTIFVGTNAGLLVSDNGGDTFTEAGIPGIPEGKYIASFTGGKQDGAIRLFALVADSVYGGIQPEDFFYPHQDLYVLDWGDTSWQLKNTGLPTGEGYGLAYVAMALNDISTAYVSGQTPDELPMIFKTINGGDTWTSALTVANNGNVRTGWEGHLGDRQWSYGGGTTGFTVAPNDKNRAAFTDYGFLHLTTDGGTTWQQAYVDPDDENPAGSATPKGKAYHGVGLEDTSCWWLHWSNPNEIFACYTDIRGALSEDGGDSWSFDFTGHTENTAYYCLQPSGSNTLYLATSSVHDLYQSTYLTDSRIDGGSGRVLQSTDQGKTWTVNHDFGHPVIWLASDPTQPARVYASVVHSSQGGIYVTQDITQSGGSVWTRTAIPTRTEGHPFNVKVLTDGTVVCTYSGRRSSSGFTSSSGVFVSTNQGSTWMDRSDSGMRYWTKDVVVDPADSSENTWYVGVFSGWGGPANDLGGLYKTTNRGQSWNRILTLHRVTSCTIDPAHTDEMYVTSETEGLWYTKNLRDPEPDFERIEGYPFRQPERVFFNPYDLNEIWVTSFGNGIRIGTIQGGLEINSWRIY